MSRYRFRIVDVFSGTAFGGNQLAVLPDATGISDEGLQRIAREFNFPESTFVLPPNAPGCLHRVRIFTPARELPFAGHPTVGTACALVRDGLAPEGEFMLEEGIGAVDVSVDRDGDALSATFLVRQRPTLHAETASAAGAAAAVGLGQADILRIFAAGLGIDFTFIQLADAAAVDRARLDLASWTAAFGDSPAGQLYLFAGDLEDGGEVYSRMFGPGFGITEDPATGSAAGILAGAAAELTGAADGQFSLSIRQGVTMGRPSLLKAGATVAGGQVVAIQVGGATAFVAEGHLDIPPDYLLD